MPDAPDTHVYRARRGRITKAQRGAYEENRGGHLTAPASDDLLASFGREAPLGLEVGFGMGQALLDWAQVAPHMNLIGVEIYRAGIGAALLGIERLALSNLRVVECPAQEFLGQHLPRGSVTEVRVLFPDPWPKSRHRKRRLFSRDFVEALSRVLEPAGCAQGCD